jgi:lipopolysaccharide biosynthesis glycosyltransferase
LSRVQDPNVDVAFVADRHAVLPLAVALHGLSKTLSFGRHATVHLLTPGLGGAESRFVTFTQALGNVSLQLIKPTQAQLAPIASLRQVRHVPPISYWRLLLPQMLPQMARILYIDADVVIKRDIAELFDGDLSPSPLAAVADAGLGQVGSDRCLSYARAELASPDAPAFNAGVLLFDLEQWRSGRLADRAIDFCRRHQGQLKWADQDGLNFAVAGRWKSLPIHWNIPASLRQDDAIVSELGIAHYLGHFDLPAIYHMYGEFKPWNSGPRHGLRHAWWAELQASRYGPPRFWRLFQRTADARANLEWLFRQLIGRRQS